jgi:hypothetical protein
MARHQYDYIKQAGIMAKSKAMTRFRNSGD